MYLFMVCSTTLSSSASNSDWLMINIYGSGTKAVVVRDKVLPRHLPGVTKEIHEKPFRIPGLTRASPPDMKGQLSPVDRLSDGTVHRSKFLSNTCKRES